MSAANTIRAHEARGRYVDVKGLSTFVREEGEGEAVLLMHGVPVSCFLYRKVLPQLATRGLRALTYDLPGLGLSDRPDDFDYSWTGLGRHASVTVDALGLDAFHLVVHDIGGPVGFELAAANPSRIRSLTVLNTLIEVDRFRRPWTMEPFAIRGLDRLWLASIPRPMFRWLMHLQGIKDRTRVPNHELDAHLELLRQKDRGAAFLKIMKGFERTPEKTALYTSVVSSDRYPVRVVWGEDDPALRLSREGEIAKRVAGVDAIHTVPAKHFLQEDRAEEVAEHVAAVAREAAAR